MKFQLGPVITPEQRAFLAEHGYLHFDRVLTTEEVATLGSAITEVESRFLAEGRTRVNGIPLFFGMRPNGERGIQRLAFVSLFSPTIAGLVRDARFEPIRGLVGQETGAAAGEEARVGENEKDGVVVNQFLNAPGSITPRLGWHTDGLRDLFYLRMPGPMLNVGLHLDECTKENGGLRLLPGTHKQGFLSMCFGKPYFVSHRADPREVCIETKPGDLTVHDGRLWHRVARSTRSGAGTLRRSMYVPYLTGPLQPKTEASRTPAYHTAARMMRRARGAKGALPVLAVFVLALAIAAVMLLIGARGAHAAGYWNFDKGVSNFGRGGANIASPEDPIAIYTNPAAIAGLSGFRIVVDGDLAWDDRRFERAGTTFPSPQGACCARVGRHPGVENEAPVWPPSPGFFATWNAAPIGAPRLTFGAAFYGPPRSDVQYPKDGPQRYQLIESHNLQIHSAIAVAYELPWKRARLGITGMAINQLIRTQLAFNTFLGQPEDPAWDASVAVKARDAFIPTATLGGSFEPIPRLTLATSAQLPYDVKAKGRVNGEIGAALDDRAHLNGGDVTVKTKMPGIYRGAAKWTADRWDVEGAVVFETWGRNKEVRFVPDGLELVDDNSGLTYSVGELPVPTHLRDTWSLRLGGERDVVRDRLTLRSGVFYERAAIAPKWLSASSFDLDKVGLAGGAHLELGRGAWMDLAGGYEHWLTCQSRNSEVRILDPLAKERRWTLGNGKYTNTRMVGMASLGFRI